MDGISETHPGPAGQLDVSADCRKQKGADGPSCSRPRAGILCFRPGRDLVLPVTTDIGEQIPLIVDVHIDGDVGAGPVRLAAGVAHIRVGGSGGNHHLLDGLADLLLAAALAGSQLPDRPVHIGLAPQLRGAVVEQVEVVDDLELDVLIVEVGIVGLGVRLVGQLESAGEEARSLAGRRRDPILETQDISASLLDRMAFSGSNEYMSMSFLDSLSRSSRAAFERQVWGEFFGDLIRSAREERSLSLEEAARGAGISPAEWESIEAGAVPHTREQLHALAAGLGLESDAMVPLVLFCQRAW
jgi:hypothetical protein